MSIREIVFIVLCVFIMCFNGYIVAHKAKNELQAIIGIGAAAIVNIFLLLLLKNILFV